MTDRKEVEEFVLASISEIFKVSVDSLNMETNFLNDLQAKSGSYVPLISKIQNEYDIELSYQKFRSKCRTIGIAVDYILDEIDG